MPDRPSPATSFAVTAVALAAAGAVHLRFGPSHLEEDVLYGAFFFGSGASQLIAAVVVAGAAARGRALSGRSHWVVVGLNAAIILVWTVTRVSGPPFGADAGQRESVEYADLLAVALQLVAIAGVVLAGRRPTPPPGRLRRSAIVAAVVTSGIAAPLVAQAVPIRHSELCESHDDGPDVGPLAAVYGHAMIEPPRPLLHTTVGQEVTAIVGKVVNCGEEPVVVTSAEQIGRRPPELADAGPPARTVGWAIGRLDGGDLQFLDRTGVKVPVTGDEVEFGLFVTIAAERPGTFGIDAVSVGIRADGHVIEQPFATILRVQIGEQS